MPDHLVLPVPHHAAAVRDLRRAVRLRCDEWGIAGPACDDLLLTVCELATNAVVHAQPPVVLVLTRSEGFVVGAVVDRTPAPPLVRPARTDLMADIDELARRNDDLPLDLRDPALHVGDSGSVAAGRGMLIIATLTEEWGVVPLGAGKGVWFRLPIG